MAAIDDSSATALSDQEAQEFVPRLQEMWLSSNPAQWAGMCREDVLLVQPLMRPIRGRSDAQRRFERLFGAFPDLKVTLLRWGQTKDSVLVEYVARATLAGRRLEWRGADRIAIRDGLIAHRVAYFDWWAVLAQVLRWPAAWPQALRSGMRPRRLRDDEFPP